MLFNITLHFSDEDGLIDEKNITGAAVLSHDIPGGNLKPIAFHPVLLVLFRADILFLLQIRPLERIFCENRETPIIASYHLLRSAKVLNT